MCFIGKHIICYTINYHKSYRFERLRQLIAGVESYTDAARDSLVPVVKVTPKFHIVFIVFVIFFIIYGIVSIFYAKSI